MEYNVSIKMAKIIRLKSNIKRENMDNTRQKGRHYEQIALEYLLSLGFELIAQNFHSRYGEIDIIMQKDSTLHFIEVKSSHCMQPLLKITPKKLERLTKTIYVFLEEKQLTKHFCIDAISIYKDNITFIENITFGL